MQTSLTWFPLQAFCLVDAGFPGHQWLQGSFLVGTVAESHTSALLEVVCVNGQEGQLTQMVLEHPLVTFS